MLLIHGNVVILSRIDAIDSQRVVICVILEGLNLQCSRESFILNLGEALTLFFHFAMAGTSDIVSDRQQVVYIPNIVRVCVKVHTHGKYFLLEVDYLL